MKTILRFFNRKGITSDAFVIVLLVIGLVVAAGIVIYFVTNGKGATDNLWGLMGQVNRSGIK